MWKKNVETFIGCESEYQNADIVLFGAHFDSTTSYRPGTRFASRAIRGESFGIETYSPYQDRDLCDLKVFDGGDLELPFGDCGRALAQIQACVCGILEDGKLPVMMGGEHLVTLGAVRAAAERYPQLHIIQFDAHADLRDSYLDVALSHACVMRRCHEIIGDGRIYQFGIRSGDRQEFAFAEKHTFMERFTLHETQKQAALLEGKPVYLTIDLDVLDPSIFPGTGTPEAGGVSFAELLAAIRGICGRLHIVGCDINELSPIYDQSGVSTAVACKLLRELLLSLR